MRKIGFLLFLLFCSYYIYAQNTIQGTVVSKDSGDSMPGVSVSEKGTTNGTMTDVDGKYEITVGENPVLVFSYIGYEKQEIAVEGQTTINVTLEVGDTELAEVVIVGYGVQKKTDLTGAISTVDMEDINKRQTSSLEQALQGQIAGLNITTSSGTPGGGMTVNIRGISSIAGGSPLFVVDGMMMDNIDFINPQDVESITVLKDHSSSVIYGSRGSDGVIIVTTKKGSKGGVKINFDGYYGIQNFWKGPSVCTAEEWAMLNNEARRAAGQTINTNLANPSSLTNVDWFDEVTRKNAVVQNYNLSISGGNENSTYFISGAYYKQEGIVMGTDYDRINFKINSEHKVKDWLTIGENIIFAKAGQNNILEYDEWNNILNAAQKMDPASPIRNADGDFQGSVNGIQVNNPVAQIEYTNDTYNNYKTVGDVYAKIKLLEGLEFKSDFNIDYSFGIADGFTPEFYVSPTHSNGTSQLSVDNDVQFIYQWTNILTYHKTFGKHEIKAMLGQEMFSQKYKYTGISVSGVFNDDPSIRYIDNASGSQSAITYGGLYEAKQLSVLSRINYDYSDKYLLTVNFRADGSSKFLSGEGRRWHYFPSFSAGWRISEESFMENLSFINNLKLRGGWGQLGNEKSLSAYSFATTATSGRNYTWGGVLAPGAAFRSVGNPALEWEVTTMTNIGLDFGFLKGKIEGSVEYYMKKTDDMLMVRSLPFSSGLERGPWENIGAMKNSGFEFTAKYQSKDKPFKYSVGIIFATIKNEVTDLGEENPTLTNGSYRDNFDVLRTRVGYPISQFYGRETNGLFQTQAEVDAQTLQSNVAPGDVRYVDQNGDGIINSDDFIDLGSAIPKFTYSLNANFEYKGFDLNMVFQGVYGNKIFNGMTYYYRSSSAYWNLKNDMLQRWTGPNTTNDARYPRMNATDVNNSLMSDRYIEDGSYLRLKTLQFGYTLPSSLTKKFKVNKLRIYLNAQNLLTFTKYTGLDPEIGMQDVAGASYLEIGVDRGRYPQARIISMGVSLSF